MFYMTIVMFLILRGECLSVGLEFEESGLAVSEHKFSMTFEIRQELRLRQRTLYFTASD